MLRFRTLSVALALVTLLATLFVSCGDPAPADPDALSVVQSLGDGAGLSDAYARALEVRPFDFPTDHGPHPDFRTEWWYFTGNLEGEEGRRFGYQLTFFRTAVAPPTRDAGTVADGASDWRTRQVYMAHFAVTDAEGERFLADERFARGAAGLAGAEAAPFHVWTGAWSARSGDGGEGRYTRDETTATFPLTLEAGTDRAHLSLTLEAGDGWVLQGDRGLSRKGEGEGNASYYYSFPRMPTLGSLTLDGETYTVRGDSWLDREWSTSLLAAGQVGWDWFSLQLETRESNLQLASVDGEASGLPEGINTAEMADSADHFEIIAFRLREAEDPLQALDAPLGYAALVPERTSTDGTSGDGTSGDGASTLSGTPAQLPLRLLDGPAARLTVLDRWTSPESGITWPSGWRLVLPDAGLDVEIQPLLRGQELNVAFRYWEGAVRVTGTRHGEAVAGWGYAELTGYGETFGAPTGP